MSQVWPLEAVEFLEGELGPRCDVVVGFGLGRRSVAVVVVVAARPEVGRRARGLEVAAPADAQPFGNSFIWYVVLRFESPIVRPLFVRDKRLLTTFRLVGIITNEPQ